MKVLGKRVLLKRPPLPTSKIQLTKEGEEELMREYLKECSALEVYGVGDEITKIEKGNWVWVDTHTVMNAPKIQYNDDVMIMVNEQSILTVYEDEDDRPTPEYEKAMSNIQVIKPEIIAQA